jgi:histidine triad (HIT) family protein
MPRDPNCVFCRIIASQIPAAVVYEDTHVVAFLDIGPLSEGHLLVIPRDHYVNVVDMPAEECAQLFLSVPVLGRALLEVTRAAGFNVLLNSGAAAGQVVPHVHCHLIPRRPGDGLGYRWNAGKYAAGRDAELAAAYRKCLGRS